MPGIAISEITPLVPLSTMRATTDALNIAATFASKCDGGKLMHNPRMGM